jgi:hypothetical protein
METHKIEFHPSRGTTVEEKNLFKLLGYAWPIRPAVDFKPDWHTNLNKTYQHDPESSPQPTAKACPGIFDHMRAGYIMPMWTDMCFRFYADGTSESNRGWDSMLSELITDTIKKPVEMHDYQQMEGVPFLEDGCPNLIKLNTPWYVNVPKGVSLFYTTPFYHINNDFSVIPGIIDADFDHISNKQVNCFIKLNKPGITIKLQQGRPLMQIIPFVRADYEFENNVPKKFKGEEELAIMDTKYGTELPDAFADDPVKKLQQNRIPKKYNV